MNTVLVLVVLTLVGYAIVDGGKDKVRGQERFTLLHAAALSLMFAVIVKIIQVSTGVDESTSYSSSQEPAWYWSSQNWFFLGIGWSVLVAASVYFLAQQGGTQPLISPSMVTNIFAIGLAFCWGASVVVAFFEKIGMSDAFGKDKGFLESFLPYL